MKLTPKELDLLHHRLSVPDAIADAIYEAYEEERDERCPWSKDAIKRTVFWLGCDLVRNKSINPKLLGPLDKMILADCLEGSTWSVPTDGTNDHKSAARVMRGLKGKFLESGIEVGGLPL